MTRKIRVLHVVGAMNRGGVETWLMHVLRNIDRDRFQMDFLVHTFAAAAFDEEIRSLGSRILRGGQPSAGLRYPRRFLQVLRESGPWDVIHSHVHHFSGVTLPLARLAGVPVRIAHSHSDTSFLERNARIRRRAYLLGCESAIDLSATHKLAASELAAASLFGARWREDPRAQVLYCGVDLPPFLSPPNLHTIRETLQIAGDAFVVGHVGSFSYPKNHSFLVDIAAETARRCCSVMFLFVGEGPLRNQVERQARDAGVVANIVFTGVRDDVPQLMAGAMDLFVLPSLYEGLPVAGIEAQAAGLPSLFSDSITREVGIVPGLYEFLPIGDARLWANRILQQRDSPRKVSQSQALEVVRESKFNISTGIDELVQIYSGNNAKLQ